MYTDPEGIAARIVRGVVTRFATESDIDPAHLLDSPADLTAPEVLRATRALPGVLS